MQARRQSQAIDGRAGLEYFHNRSQLRKACLIAVPVTSILWCPLIWFIFRML